MVKGLVTVVVPIYNTEKYLDRCISSIVNQTYRNLEILLIDDGSPDNCPQMCDDWAGRDHRIRVFHKENAGLGMARNTGIEYATGEYICFLDSDDYIALDTVEKTYDTAVKNQAEVVSFGFCSVDVTGKIYSTFVPPGEKRTYRGDSVQTYFLPELIAPDPEGNGERQFYMSACMMLFSMELIRRAQWRFVSERIVISEDVYSLLDLFGEVDSVAILPEALYYYCENVKSVSRKYVPGRYQRIRDFYLACINLCDRKGYGKCIRKRLTDPFLAFTRAAMKQESAADIPYRNKIQHIKIIMDDEILQGVLKENEKDHANISRRIFFHVMKNKMCHVCYCLLTARNAAVRR